jgi:recombinational DNA repair protein (RecF pathway)
MAHTIFSTRGIILKRQSTGETNIFVYILTENLGLVIANAQGVRTSKSKLSSSLTEFSFGTYSLVKAKNGWRVTDAESDGNFYFNLKRDKGEDKQNNFNAQNLLAKISDLLIKLIPGESHDQKLFECVNSGFKFLVSESSSDSIENNLECILV